jgi:hypothetical protein
MERLRDILHELVIKPSQWRSGSSDGSPLHENLINHHVRIALERLCLRVVCE